MPDYEDDISAEEKIKIQSSWIQSKNEHGWRKKSFSCKKSKRKKSFVSIGRRYVAFCYIIRKFEEFTNYSLNIFVLRKKYDILRILKKIR